MALTYRTRYNASTSPICFPSLIESLSPETRFRPNGSSSDILMRLSQMPKGDMVPKCLTKKPDIKRRQKHGVKSMNTKHGQLREPQIRRYRPCKNAIALSLAVSPISDLLVIFVAEDNERVQQ